MIYYLDLFGISVFAISGALMAKRKKMDLFGAIVLACVTAVGGGTLRDLLLGSTPVFWVNDPTYLWLATSTAVFIFFFQSSRKGLATLLLLADAFGLALFCVLGTQKALTLGIDPSIAVLMGVLSGSAGGLIRDTLSGEPPLILHQEIYATAAFVGSFTYYWLHQLIPDYAMLMSVCTALMIRLAAIHWKLRLPSPHS